MLHVLICGNSIFLAGLAASLSQRPGWVVACGDLTILDGLIGPEAVVIVDAAQTGEALTRLLPWPGWYLFSVDLAAGTLTTYVARSHPVQELAEVEQKICQIAERSNAVIATTSPAEISRTSTT